MALGKIQHRDTENFTETRRNEIRTSPKSSLIWPASNAALTSKHMRQLPVVTPTPPGELAIDPVCGMTVPIATAAGSFEYEGRKYYFCSQHCLQRFRENPAQFLSDSPKPAAPVSQSRMEYTCPMHPE